MSANVESMFYVGETPWHGLGKPVDEALSSAQALEMSGLDWEVDSKKIQVCGGKGIAGYKANVRSSDGKVLGIVTDKYKIVQNKEAFAFTDELLGNGVKYETAGSLAGGQRTWMLAKMDTTKICGDDVEPYLVFSNSHDGKGAVRVAMTPVRVVCQNTLTFALSSAKRTWAVQHMGDISKKLEDAQNTIFNATNYLEAIKAESEKMTEIVVVPAQLTDFLEAMFPMSKDPSDRQKNNVNYARDAFRALYENKEDLQKFKGTAYGVLQAVADYAPHFKSLRKTDTYAERNFMSIVDGGKTSIMDKACAYFQMV